MCEPRSTSDYFERIRAHNEWCAALAAEQPRHMAILRNIDPFPPSLQGRLDEIEREKNENIARIERERDERIAAIDRNYKLVDEALSMRLPDSMFWVWVFGLSATAGIIQILKGLLS